MVLYDTEERLALSIAVNWFEKGIENFAVLTGMIYYLTNIWHLLALDSFS